MAKADRGGAGRASDAEAVAPAAGALAAAVALAAVAGLWSLFQWTELEAARAGRQVFCGFGDSANCARAWASPFASFVQRWTGLPVAGWGLTWSFVALALPLGALVRRARGGSAEPYWSGTVVTALAGVLACAGLAVALFSSGDLCATCVLTYGIVLLYAGVCLSQGVRLAAAGNGLGLAAGATAMAFAVLLVPGLRGEPPASGAASLAGAPVVPRATAEPGEASPGDQALRDYLTALAPETRRAIAEALAQWAASPAQPVRPPRSLIGPADAPVRLTEFADVLCGHCADLHHSLAEIRRRVPAESLAIEPRQFPLDGACNPHVGRATPDAVRCTAARAIICLEGQPGAFAFAGSLFEGQRGLDEERIFEAAAPFLDAEKLRACIRSPETEQRLQADIDWAVERGIRGTPLVLVNGREAPALPPFLYALVLAEGDPSHPAFSALR